MGTNELTTKYTNQTKGGAPVLSTLRSIATEDGRNGLAMEGGRRLTSRMFRRAELRDAPFLTTDEHGVKPRGGHAAMRGYLLDSGRAGGIMQTTGNQPEAVQ